MSRVPARSVQPSPPIVIREQPHASLDSVSTIAPSVGSISGLNFGGSSAPVPAGIGEPLTGRSVDTFTSNPYGQIGVTAFTEGVYTEDGNFNPAFSESVMENTGQLMRDMVGEETMEKLEQRYTKAMDKVTDIEMSAGQIAMAGNSLDYLAGDGEEEPLEMGQVEEEEVPVDDVPDVGEMPDTFSTELIEPEADAIATDLHELDVDQLGQIATATGYLPQMELIRMANYLTVVRGL